LIIFGKIKNTIVDSVNLWMPYVVIEKNDILLVSYGNLVELCVEVREKDPRISVLVINRLRPLDDCALTAALDLY
jgi:hypothetical protein